MSAVRVRGVTASYTPGVPVLHAVDLDVFAGSTTAVLGASGCGKTTLLRIIAGFVRPDAGEVEIGDRLVSGPGRHVPPERRGIGYVRQDGGLFPHLDVGGNVAFGWDRRRRRRREGVGDLLELVGLDPRLARRRPDELSGGQQQRVALARALALEPDVVLLDEPFSSLDTGLRAQTRAAVARALAERDATAVLVTHDQGEALSFADQVAILRGGRLTSVGAPRTVYEQPTDLAEAAFLGDAVRLEGVADAGVVRTALGDLTVDGPPSRGEVEVLVRPEQVRLRPPGDGAVGAVVERTSYFGHDALAILRAGDVVVSARVRGSELPEPGDAVSLTVEGPVRTFARA